MTHPFGTTPAPPGTSPKATVRRYYELVDAHDVNGLVQLFAPDASYHRPGYPPLVGRAELARFYGEQRVIAEGKHHLDAVIAEGGTVAVRGQFTGLLKDDRRVDIRFADFFAMTQDGHFARRDTFFFAPLV